MIPQLYLLYSKYLGKLPVVHTKLQKELYAYEMTAAFLHKLHKVSREKPYIIEGVY